VSLAANLITTSLGLVFLSAGINKLLHPAQFATAVKDYRVIPDAVATPVATALIIVECFIGVSLLAGRFIGPALLLSAAILLAFIGAVGLNLYRHRVISCGCFGNPNEQITSRTICRLFIYLAAVTVGLVSGRGDLDIGRGLLSDGDIADGLLRATLSVAANLIVMWVLALPEVTGLLRWSLEHSEPSLAPQPQPLNG
jgi:uncharacterized membrane protein YphA (DoxX/SURF4 family)